MSGSTLWSFMHWMVVILGTGAWVWCAIFAAISCFSWSWISRVNNDVMSRVFLFNISASALVYNAPSPSDASMEPEPLTSHTSGALFHMLSTVIKPSQLCLIVHLHFQTLQWNWNHRVLIHQAPCFICHLNFPRPYRSISSVGSVGPASRR